MFILFSEVKLESKEFMSTKRQWLDIWKFANKKLNNINVFI